MSPIRRAAMIGGIVLGLLLIALSGETLFAGRIPAGTALCAIEGGVGLWALIRLLGAREWWVAGSVLFYWFADLLFFGIQYSGVLGGGFWSPIATGLYDLSFLSSAIWFAKRPGFFDRGFLRRAGVPVGLVLILLGFYFIPALSEAKAQGAPTWFPGWLESGSIGVTAVALVFAFFVLIHSAIGRTSLIAVGVVIQCLVNFALTAEVFRSGQITFGFYEFFWAAGVFLIGVTAGVIPMGSTRDEIHANSISARFHSGVISLTLVVVVAATGFGISGKEGIRLVSIVMAAGVGFALVLSAIAVGTVERYSKIFGRALERGFTSALTDQSSIDRLPTELEALFGAVFERSVRVERERRERWDDSLLFQKRLVHDLRNPLLGLRGLLKDAKFHDPSVQAACMESLDSLDRVSSGILMGRDGELSHKPSVWSKSAVSLSKQIFQLERWFTSVNRQAGRSIRFSILHAPPNGVFGWVDEVLLERFLMNTVQNATESPGVESISIDSRLDGDRIELRVHDDGRGCPPEILSKINSGLAVTAKRDGHGFGLSGPVEGLRSDGAEVRFESEVGAGFCAIIRIPLASPKVVLVDDDRAIRLVWRTLARSKGIDFHALEPTDEALEQLLAHEDRKTEIFVDLHLGDRSGIEVLKTLQSAGFQRLFLASAEPELAPDPSAFPVRNKEFPRSSL